MLRQGDFPYHIGYTVALTQGELKVPHFLFHTVTAEGIFFGLTPRAAALVVTLGFQALAAWGVAWMARRAGASPLTAMCLGIAAVCISPILPLEVAADGALYRIGYFLPNPLHSPTATAGKAFVPLLIEFGATLSSAASVSWSWPGVAAIVLIAGLAKPHYVSCVLPVVIVACAWHWWRDRQVPWKRVAAFVAAAVAVLLWTVVGTPALTPTGARRRSLRSALRTASDNQLPVDALSLAARACSDLVFPIGVLALWPEARRSRPSCWRGRPMPWVSDRRSSSPRPAAA